MSLRVPLTVRLRTARADRHITAQVRDLSFRSTVPGGFANIQIKLDRPLSIQPDEIDYFAACFIYDGRTGETVCEGLLEDPGRTAGRSGQTWALTAMGPAARAYDRTVPLIYVDRRHEPWKLHNASAPPWERVALGEGNSNGLQLAVRQGGTLATGETGRGRLTYSAIAETGQLLGRVASSWDTGLSGADDVIQLLTSLNNGSTTKQDEDNWSTSGGTVSASRGGGNPITAGHNWCDLTSIHAGAPLTVVNDTQWATFTNIVVRALLKDAAGADIITDYTLDTVLASQIVTDLLGRLLTVYDGPGAAVAATSYAIDQLAYPDGVSPGNLLEDLMRFEPGFFWAAWESNAAGKHRFEWSQWPATIGYDATIVDGFSSPGSAAELYNEVTVRWRDKSGIRTVTRSLPVAALTAAGLTRTEFIDLGDEVGSQDNAERVGDQFLLEHAVPPVAGQLAISRPIGADPGLGGGRTVAPWQIRPGRLIRVRGTVPSMDALSSSARDGAVVFQIKAVDYRADANTATLELDSRPRTTAHILAEAAKAIAPIRRRR